MKENKKVIFIVGPTAVGKTDIAFLLAQRAKGEIISCDSMQVYKELRIANNKPPAEYLEKIPHHLIDLVSVEEEFDVSRFNVLALSAIKDIHQKSRIPIVAGGSGLYMQILIDGIFNCGEKDEKLRIKLFQMAEEEGKESLHAMLKEKDPFSAQKIHANDLKKVVRALEVCIKEKKPMSELQKQRQGIWDQYAIMIYCINRDRQELYSTIEQRVEEMFEEGIVEEMKTIQSKLLTQGARSIIGVKEVLGYLNGDYDIDYAKYLMKLHTRRLAKRQLTWFRKDPRIQWLDLNEKTKEEILNIIVRDNHL